MIDMKKLILFILLSLCIALQASAWNPMIMTSGTSAAVCDTTNIVFWWRVEALDFSADNGTTDYSIGDDVGTFASDAAINTDARYGTTGNGLDIPSDYDNVYFEATNLTALDDEGRAGFWVYFNNLTSPDGAVLFRVYDASTDVFRLRIEAPDELEAFWRDASISRTMVVTTDANIVINTWYWIEVAWKTSTNYREIFVNGSAPTQTGAGTTINSFGTAVVNFGWGDTDGAAPTEIDFYIDNVMISTDSTHDLNLCKDETEWPE